MTSANLAVRAYGASRGALDLRVQEADVFRRVTGGLRAAAQDETRRARALSDMRRLWIAMEGALADPHNQLPRGLRAGIISIGRAVQRELDEPNPDFGFLIEMNESIALGLDPRAAP
jgi:flagellar biosynthesis activator protein FlaF